MTLEEFNKDLITFGRECIPHKYREVIMIPKTHKSEWMYIANQKKYHLLIKDRFQKNSLSTQIANNKDLKELKPLQTFTSNKDDNSKQIEELYPDKVEKFFLEEEKQKVKYNIDLVLSRPQTSIFQLIKAVGLANSSRSPEDFTSPELQPLKNKKPTMNKFPLNQILYGPPGTGKTYHTISRALEIIGEDLEGKSRAEIKKLFDAKIKEEQIVFTTFHQSLGYEDFIEGIKPVEPEKDEDPVSYRVELGIFRKLCIEASFAIADLKENKETEEVLEFSFLYDKFSETVEEQLVNGQKVELDTKAGGSVLVESISQQGNFIIKHHEGTRTYTVSKARLTKLQAAIKNLDDINNINDQFRAIIGGSNSSAYWSVLNAIRKEKSTIKRPKENRTYTFEEKREVVLSLAQADYKIDEGNNIKNYVLIIDEINRGNISQIFGELITLLEESKRLGKAEGLTAVLPYSKQKFGIPPNLYVIGTMNTADRSVEALDTALRRRFDFEEMLPSPELLNSKQLIIDLWNADKYSNHGWDDEPYRSHADRLYTILGVDKGIEKKYHSTKKSDEPKTTPWETNDLDHISSEDLKGINFELLLETINKRIEKLIDKDHCIGHSYFLTLSQNPYPEEELRNIFQNKIIPLLQEYFFGDLGKMELVIGKAFFESQVPVNASAFFADNDYEDTQILVERKVYKIRNVKRVEFDIIAAAKKIYQ